MAVSKPAADSGGLGSGIGLVLATPKDIPMFEACRNGELDIVKAFITTLNVNMRDTSGRKSTPLHFAAGMTETKTPHVNLILMPSRSVGFGRHAIVEFLLEKGAHVDIKDEGD